MLGRKICIPPFGHPKQGLDVLQQNRKVPLPMQRLEHAFGPPKVKLHLYSAKDGNAQQVGHKNSVKRV